MYRIQVGPRDCGNYKGRRNKKSKIMADICRMEDDAFFFTLREMVDYDKKVQCQVLVRSSALYLGFSTSVLQDDNEAAYMADFNLRR